MVAADALTAITFALSPGEAHDAPEGRKLLRELGQANWPIHLLMDRAYEGDETRQLALDLNFIPVVPPKSNRVNAWEYDREMYKRRNEIERLFRRLKGFRRIFSRFEKLDVMFIGFINFALIVEALRSVNTPAKRIAPAAPSAASGPLVPPWCDLCLVEIRLKLLPARPMMELRDLAARAAILRFHLRHHHDALEILYGG